MLYTYKALLDTKSVMHLETDALGAISYRTLWKEVTKERSVEISSRTLNITKLVECGGFL